jgi:N-acyl homoserine lactone hydrolase
MMRIGDIQRILLGTFVRPAEETATGDPRVEAVYGYLARRDGGLLLLDTGLGIGDAETGDWYRPRRVALPEALGTVGVALEDITVVVNCHLHFDHCGGNPLLAGTPVLCQRRELATAQRGDYTMDHLIDYPGSNYDLLDGGRSWSVAELIWRVRAARPRWTLSMISVAVTFQMIGFGSSFR